MLCIRKYGGAPVCRTDVYLYGQRPPTTLLAVVRVLYKSGVRFRERDEVPASAACARVAPQLSLERVRLLHAKVLR